MKNTTILLAALWLAAATLFSQNKGASPLANPQSAIHNPQSTRAVVIGISDYQDVAIPDLRFADKDAEAFANFLRSPAGGSLDNGHLQVLTNENATAGRVAEALDALIEQAKEGEEVIIYFSGHGDVERKTVSQPGFLLCWDAPARVYMGGGTYSLAFLQEIVTTLSTQNKARVVVVTDACHSGKLAGSQIGGSHLTAASLARQFSNEVKILSCQPGELSLEGEQWGGGRGCFSFHLIEGLAGLADKNGDGQVTLGEIDRYLEDHVTAEAAPQSQVPMLLGNKTNRLATVSAAFLAELKKAKAGGLPMFAAIEGRGFEDEFLEKADSSTRRLYFSFKKAVAEKRFFSPESDCAEKFYAQLAENEALAPLRGMMKRNYAAALQDDAQQAMNAYLKTDVLQIECIGTSTRLGHIPRQLERAAALLGEGHYMHRSLLARKSLFEGIDLILKNTSPDAAYGSRCLERLRASMALEPQSPLPLQQMVDVFMSAFRQPDSAWACAERARALAPNWVLPFAQLGAAAVHSEDYGLALRALREAEKIDPANAYVVNGLANWHAHQPSEADQQKALALYENYRASGAPTYPCWHNDYGGLLAQTGRFEEAEAEVRRGIALDSLRVPLWNTLGMVYFAQQRFDDAVPVVKRALALDPTDLNNWNSLAALLNMTRRFDDAEPIWQKIIALDSTAYIANHNLGYLYYETGQLEKAVAPLREAVRKKPGYFDSWQLLGRTLVRLGRYAEAEAALRTAASIDPARPVPPRLLGTACFKTGRPEEAEKHFRHALELDPGHFPALLGLAYLSTAKGETVAALGFVEQAIGKKAGFEQLQKDPDLAPLRALPEWTVLMKKHFPDKAKD